MAAVGRSSKGIEYPAHDGLPVFGVFLVLSPLEPAGNSLRSELDDRRHILGQQQ